MILPRPRRALDPFRLTLVLLGRCFAWREALASVQPGTLLCWHREPLRLFWRWRSRPRAASAPGDASAADHRQGPRQSVVRRGTDCHGGS
jgi:hypothetical protein